VRRRRLPAFSQQDEPRDHWERFPGRERLDGDKIALTFDDGPDEDATPDVLDALADAGIKATFFVVGEQLMRHHRIARRAIDEGHEIALHGFSHRAHADLIPPDARDEIPRGVGAFQAALAGLSPKLYRPPYGRFTEFSYKGCLGMELEPVYWSSWGMDWEAIGGREIADLVIKDLAPGSIVLLHDSPRYAEERDTAWETAQAIPLIAAAAKERGLEWTTISGANQ